MYVPSVSAAQISTAKVVIIVGPVSDPDNPTRTDSFRQRGDAAYAEAIKYTPNVKKVYSPNATWAAVLAATKGANIVIYMGHGNGWPSPYTYDPLYATKDGFGLNATAGNGDRNHKYYGEPDVAQLQLAPNAIILLHHLCYASGNGESSSESPSLWTGKQRVQNYAAGFLKSPARAVLADGHRGAAEYLKALFTTSQTIVRLWRSVPSANGNDFSFASGRSSGYTAYMDPEAPNKFYRSLVTKPTLTTREVTGVIGDTGIDPATFTVPGRASVFAEGGELLNADGLAIGSLPAATRLSLVSRPVWTVPNEGTTVFEVSGLDATSISGYVRTSQLIPRDSVAPLLLGVEAAPSAVSPNDDNAFDSTDLSARFSETVTWTLRVDDANGAKVAEASGTGKEPAVGWDALVDEDALPDGTYRYTFRGQDAWLNAPTPVAKAGTVRVDTTGPTLSEPAAVTTTPWFSPNGDANRDTFAMKGTISETGSIEVRAVNSVGSIVSQDRVGVSAGAFTVSWDGKDNAGVPVPDGTYSVRLIPLDALQNRGAFVSHQVNVIKMLGAVRTTKTLFFPQDRDTLAPNTTLSFSLSRPATVTWTIRNAAGTVVDTLVGGEVLEAGAYTRVLAGRRLDGTMLPVGKYVSYVTATDGELTAAQSVAFQMNAFAVTSSASAATRGRSITIYATTSETLSAAPRVYIVQPGKSTWSVAMTRISAGKYRASPTLKTGGSSGTVTFRVRATDSKGGTNFTDLKLPLR
jgi:flagellar hook assembly protein FlgD